MASQAVSINAAGRLRHSRLRSRVPKEEQQWQQEPSRRQQFQVIELPNGMKKYRLMVGRTGKETSFDILEESIPLFVKKIIIKSTALSQNIIYWGFTCSFWKLAFASIIVFFVLCIIFAFLILASVHRAPLCLNPDIGMLPFREKFNDALHLSWTTFTTVGYGIISPSTGGREEFLSDPSFFDKEGLCLLVNIILSFESLMGVLFVGLCSAILFGKLMSFQSNAKVAFSTIMVVNYGKKEFIENDDDSDDDAAAAAASLEEEKLTNMRPKNYKFACPILRFRIANELHSSKSGEITDANLNVFATIDAKNSILAVKSERVFGNAMQLVDSEEDLSISSSFRGISSVRQTAATVWKKRAHATSQGVKSLSRGVRARIRHSASIAQPSRLRNNYTMGYFHPSSDVYYQEETDMDQPNLVFTNVHVEPSRHPYFCSSWVVSHALDATSPLLKKSIRERIKDNNGYWPEDLQSMEGIKDSIHFDQFLVSFSGNSKIAGGAVYRQKIYTMEDLKIGFLFKSLLMRNPDNSIFVRVNDIDMVQKQKLDHRKTESYFFEKYN